ncbi:MAG: pilus assembly protein PilM [Candidatus Kryptonium sp.]
MIFITVKLGRERIYIAETEELSRKLVLKKTLSQSLCLETFSFEKAVEIASVISSSINISEKFTKISFCLDTEFAFLNVIPVDANLSEKELNQHLSWEIFNYFPGESVHNFAIRGYKFGTGEIHKMLVAAVRKEIISFARTIADKLNLKVQIIDIDHFAAENCLRERISPTRSKYIYSDFILVGLKERRIDVSLFKNYEFKRYFYYVVNSESDLRYFVIKLINDNISAGFEKFVFYGEVSEEVIDLISEMLGNKFLFLNPFDSPLFLDIKVNPKNASVFAPNIGLMLRMLWSG